jgi:Clp amino terminal domain, pathogenicity island component
MTDSPIPLDNLIAYVKAMHLSQDPLENLSDAVKVAAALDEQSDALIGYFVDHARRSGAPWSEIGASMGVSKQAVQKRFVTRPEMADLVPKEGLFSRFTLRARRVVSSARQIAQGAGSTHTTTAHLTAALLTEPEGFAAIAIRDLGVTDAQLLEALSLSDAAIENKVSVPEGDEPFDEASQEALREALKAALRLGHNYIGTEHILLGILRAGGEATDKLNELGISVDDTEAKIAELLATMKLNGPPVN